MYAPDYAPKYTDGVQAQKEDEETEEEVQRMQKEMHELLNS